MHNVSIQKLLTIFALGSAAITVKDSSMRNAKTIYLLNKESDFQILLLIRDIGYVMTAKTIKQLVFVAK